MLLPNEALLDVLLIADFNTLVSAKFVDATFRSLVTANEHLLAAQRRFNVLLLDSYISYDYVMNGAARRKSIRYERANLPSLAAACRALADVIGHHAVVKVTFFENVCTMAGADVVFELVPALKYAKDLSIFIPKGSQSGDLLPNFARLQSLYLRLDYDTFCDFVGSFLRSDAARELHTATATLTCRPTDHHMGGQVAWNRFGGNTV